MLLQFSFTKEELRTIDNSLHFTKSCIDRDSIHTFSNIDVLIEKVDQMLKEVNKDVSS